MAGLVLLALAGSAHAADLRTVYHWARQNDARFQGARAALAAAKEQIPEARAGLLPQLAASGSDTGTRAATVFNDPVFGPSAVNRSVGAWTWMVQLTQPVLRISRIFAYQASQWRVRQAFARYAEARQDLILRVTRAYFNVLTANARMAVATAEVTAMAEQAVRARRGYAAGLDAVTDVDEAKARAALARARRVAARDAWENARAALAQIVGRPVPDRLAALGPARVAPRPVPDAAGPWITQAETRNPAVRAAAAALAAARAEVRRRRSAYAPTVDLVASYGANDSSGSLTTPDNYSTRMHSWAAGVELNVPLFAGGGAVARVAQAIAHQNQAEAALWGARRQAATEARDAYSGIENGRAQIAALTSAVAASRSAVKGDRIGYRLGIRINLDVLNAEAERYQAERALVKARYDTLYQGFKLKAAAGVLSAADVRTINALLIEPAVSQGPLTPSAPRRPETLPGKRS
ncbi:MAG: TolC family outer membrane protein [Acidiferrobacteraceae bacterium]